MVLLLVACDSDRESETTEGGGLTPTIGGSGGIDSVGDTGDSDDAETGSIKLDVGAGGSGGPQDCMEGQDCPDACDEVEHVPCDDATQDPFAAMGLGCSDEIQVTTTTQGSADAIGVRTGFGSTQQWAPREGSAFAVLGSGLVADLDNETPQNDGNAFPTHCSDPVPGSPNPGNALPAPIRVNEVGGDCEADPSLLGTGDCSNTIASQFEDGIGIGANDYAEMRIIAQVPEGNNSISYDFAFFSTEYPEYFGEEYNDMYIGWLESESWTGNISFDENGSPISLNAGFLDFRDDAGTLPEFAGTCMRQHAGTKWLSSTAPVTPGEQITVVLAIFDLTDAILDSYVFLDNWQWGCEGTSGPVTVPVG